jgi:hypothetical protein
MVRSTRKTKEEMGGKKWNPLQKSTLVNETQEANLKWSAFVSLLEWYTYVDVCLKG